MISNNKKHWFEIYYQKGSGPLYNSKTIFAKDELDAIDLMYKLIPGAYIFDVHPIGKSLEILGINPAFSSLSVEELQ